MPPKKAQTKAAGNFFEKLKLDARPDSLDFRDRMFVPTLVEVPRRIPLERYQEAEVPILNQGVEGACTGFGLATVAHYLLRRRLGDLDVNQVSPRMMYEMARRYDEWPGENYQGSSARGAMKGWHKHGVCGEKAWPYKANDKDLTLTNLRASDAILRPLGAYFRVPHKDLIAMHSALAEVGVLFATATVHQGWNELGSDGIIPWEPDIALRGGHAFAIVAYDADGFWIQNSWGARWGKKGFAQISYDDWLKNSMDVWVARLGAPVRLRSMQASVAIRQPSSNPSQAYTFSEMRPHVVSLANQGEPQTLGTYANTAAQIEKLFAEEIPAAMADWPKKRILLYAHGGLVGENAFIQRVAKFRSDLMKLQIYPVAFTWNTDLLSTIKGMLEDVVRKRKPEGFFTDALDFMLDRLDDTLEPLVRAPGRLLWEEMKENAWQATLNPNGGARLVADVLSRLQAADPGLEIHIAGHSAGSIFHAPLLALLTGKGRFTTGKLRGKQGLGLTVSSCTLWAPGITISDFLGHYVPALQNGNLRSFNLYTLSDEAERDDTCANIYNKSLLYLVSNSFETRYDEPLLGLAKHVANDKRMQEVFRDLPAQWVVTPNDAPSGSNWESTARSHGAFTEDAATLRSTVQRMLRASQ